MKTYWIAGVLATGLGLAVGAPSVAAHDASNAAHSAAAATVAAPQLQAALRELWHGHIVTTRDYGLAVHADDNAAADKAATAVVANAQQIADAVAGFYGEDAGKGLMQLLAGHWQGVRDLTLAAKAGDKAAEGRTVTELADNAGAIAKFLAGANPNWPEDGLRGALVMHTVDHKTQLDLMMANAPQAEQDTAWNRMQEHMDMIADTLADGIAKQFPDKAQ